MNFSRSTRASALALALLAPAFAAEDPAAVQLNPFVVSTDKDRGYISTNSESATRIDTPVRDLSIPITIINSAYLKDLDAQSITEAMQFSASFDIDNRRVRGLEAMSDGNANRNGVYVNGNQLENMATTERIEVFKGPSSIINGASTPGGVFNLVSKRPRWKPGGRVEAQLTSFDRRRVLLEHHQPISKRFSLLGLFQRYKQTENEWGQPALDEADIWYLAGVARLWQGAEVQLDFEYGNVVQTHIPLDAFFGGALNGGSVPYHFLYGMPLDFIYGGGDSVRENDRYLGNLSFSQRFSDRVSAFVRYSFQNRHQFDPNAVVAVQSPTQNPATPVDPALGRRPAEARRNWIFNDRNEVNHEVELRWLWQPQTWGFKHKVFGWYRARWAYYDFTAYRHRTAGSLVADRFEYFPLEALSATPERYHAVDQRSPAFNWVWNNHDTTAAFDQQFTVRHQGELATRYGRFLSIAGINRSWTERDTGGSQQNAAGTVVPKVILPSPHQERTTGWLPTVGVVYQPSRAVALYAAANKSYAVTLSRNSFNNLIGNPSGKSRELGVKLDALDGKLVGTLGRFDATHFNRAVNFPNYPIKDSVLADGTVVLTEADQSKWDAVTNPIVGGGGTERRAVGEFVSKGWDAELTFTPRPAWQTVLSYSYVDAETTKDFNRLNIGRRETNHALHTVGVVSNWQIPWAPLKGLTLGGGYRWSSECVDSYQIIGGENALYEKDGFNTLDAFGKYRRKLWGKNWSLQLNVTNLLREDRLTGIVPGTQLTTRERYRFERPTGWRTTVAMDY
jgi:outer membrane receptor protein involved in Fe transport